MVDSNVFAQAMFLRKIVASIASANHLLCLYATLESHSLHKIYHLCRNTLSRTRVSSFVKHVPDLPRCHSNTSDSQQAHKNSSANSRSFAPVDKIVAHFRLLSITALGTPLFIKKTIASFAACYHFEEFYVIETFSVAICAKTTYYYKFLVKLSLQLCTAQNAFSIPETRLLSSIRSLISSLVSISLIEGCYQN